MGAVKNKEKIKRKKPKSAFDGNPPKNEMNDPPQATKMYENLLRFDSTWCYDHKMTAANPINDIAADIDRATAQIEFIKLKAKVLGNTETAETTRIIDAHRDVLGKPFEKDAAYYNKLHLAQLAAREEQILDVNDKACHDMEKVIQKKKITKHPKVNQDKKLQKYRLCFNDIPPELLEINKKVFENFEQVVNRITILHKPKQRGDPPQADTPSSIESEDSKKEANIKEVNKRAFDYVEKVIEQTPIIEPSNKPKAASKTSPDIPPELLEINKKLFENFEQVVNRITNLQTAKQRIDALQTAPSSSIESEDSKKEATINEVNTRAFDYVERVIEQTPIIEPPNKPNAATQTCIEQFQPKASPDILPELLEINKKLLENFEQVVNRITFLQTAKQRINALQATQSSSIESEDSKKEATIKEVNTRAFDDVERVIEQTPIIEPPNKPNAASQICIEQFQPKTSPDILPELLEINKKLLENFEQVVNRITNLQTAKQRIDTFQATPSSSIEYENSKKEATIKEVNTRAFDYVERVIEQTPIIEPPNKPNAASKTCIEQFQPKSSPDIPPELLEINKLLFENFDQVVNRITNLQTAKQRIDALQAAPSSSIESEDSKKEATIKEVNTRAFDYVEKVVEQTPKTSPDIDDITAHSIITEMNIKAFQKMQKSFGRKNKLYNKSKKPTKITQTNTYIHNKMNLLMQDFDKLKEQTKILIMNQMVFEKTERRIRNIDFIKEQINILEMNMQAFEKMENDFAEMFKNTQKVPSEFNKDLAYKLTTFNFILPYAHLLDSEGMKELIDMLQIKPIFKNIEKMMAGNAKNKMSGTSIDQAAKPTRVDKNLSEQTNQKIKSSIDRNTISKPVFTHMDNMIQVDSKTYTNLISTLQPKFELYDNTLGEIAFRQKQALALVCQQLLKQISDAHGREVDTTEEENSSTTMLESYPLSEINSQEESYHEISEHERSPDVRNIQNGRPLCFRNNLSTVILRGPTFWNAQPKFPLPTTLNNNIYAYQSKIRNRPKKYKLVTKEMRSLLGEKIKITHLITDPDGQ